MAQSYEERIRFANAAILGNGDLEAVDTVFAADYVVHVGSKTHKGPRFVKKFAKELRAALPNLRVAKVVVLSAAGDTVSWERTLRGTHQAPLKGIPPSGKRVEWRDMLVTRFKGGKIVEEWAVSELAGQLVLQLPPR